MTQTISTLAPTPAEIVEQIAAKSRVRHTPCGDGNLVWHEWGDAPRRLVLFHGGHGSWLHWLRNVEFFSRYYTVLAVDFPGSGDSADAPAPQGDGAFGYQLGDIVSKGLDMLIPSDAPPYHLAGFSFGGTMAGIVATTQEPRLASLTIVGSNGMGLKRGEVAPMIRWRNLTDEKEILAAHRNNLGAHMMADKSKIDDLAIHLQNLNTRKCRLRSPAISRTDILSEALARVKTPVNGIWGERDATTWPYHQMREDALRKDHPELLYQIVPGAGHWVPFEATDVFNPLLLKFLRAREQ